MQATPAERKTSAGAIFHELAERFKKRGIVVILSDLFDDVDAMMAGLKHFRHRRHEVVLFHVLDPAELDFPFRNTTLFRGLEELPEVLVEPRALRKAYLREFKKYCRRLKKGCRLHRIDYVRDADRPAAGRGVVELPIVPDDEVPGSHAYPAARLRHCQPGHAGMAGGGALRRC